MFGLTQSQIWLLVFALFLGILAGSVLPMQDSQEVARVPWLGMGAPNNRGTSHAAGL